jgi:hypothetical protein
MTDCIITKLEADASATLKSPNFFEIEEVAPDGTTVADIEAGILNGTYTPVDPSLYTYEGKVGTDYNKTSIYDLTLTVETVTIDGTASNGGTNTYDVVKFSIPPSVTSTWDNREHTLIFDVKRTEIADTDNVDIWIKGTIKVSPVMTR